MNVDLLLEWPFKNVIQSYTIKDTILYALSVGFGADPTDENHLRYVFEKDLITVPTMAFVLGHPGHWMTDPAADIDFAKIVVGEQSLEIHQPLAPQATIRARERISGVIDKGPNKGALVYTERHIVDHNTDLLLATLRGTLFCRGDGGCGSSRTVVKQVHEIPSTEPERVVELESLRQSALIYRLNGDSNPLHADPAQARKVGFEKPILHGFCTYGFAVHALLRLWCGYNSSLLKSVTARLTAIVYPGETFIIETWKNSKGNGLFFRTWVKERMIKVLDNGYAELAI